MLHGAWTAQAAHTLSTQIDSNRFDVLCAHRDNRSPIARKSRVRLGQIVCWMGFEFDASSRLSFPDVAVVDRASGKAVLLVEVEESKAPPKLVLADFFGMLLGDCVTFGRSHEKLKIGEWTTSCVFVKSTGRGSGDQQLQSLVVRLDEARKQLTTPNKRIGRISIQAYRSESDLCDRMSAQTEEALRQLSGT